MRTLSTASIRITQNVRKVCCRAAVPSNHEAKQMLKEAIVQAKDICHDQKADEIECIIAWDTVDEIARGIANREWTDPLEQYCVEHEEEDECRMYDV